MAAKWEFTRKCEAPWRHTGTRKLSAHTYPFQIEGEYRRLCSACWKIADDQRGIKNRGIRNA
jgi:hypothetical protein